MTTTVKKGAGRPAHAAKKRKHDQRDVVVGGKRDEDLKVAARTPQPRFTMIGKGKYVHVIHTAAFDRKNSGCQAVRKALVAERINYKKSNKGLSPEAALSLDTCEQCGTAEVAKRMLPAETKRQAAKDKRDEVLSRTKPDRKASKTKATSKVDPKPKDRKPVKAMAGFRSSGSGYADKSQGKAEELATFARENGWSAEVNEDGKRWQVSMTKDDMLIECWFLDGKFDLSKEGFLAVGSWRGKLRAAHAVRRQIDRSLDQRMRPHPNPGAGRSVAARNRKVEDIPEDESPEDAARRVPFSMDDPDVEIIDAVLGKTIRWRNSISNVVEEAVVPGTARGAGKHCKRDKVMITAHPKTGRRMLDFLVVDGVGEHGEVYGPERVVALDRIIRVIG